MRRWIIFCAAMLGLAQAAPKAAPPAPAEPRYRIAAAAAGSEFHEGDAV